MVAQDNEALHREKRARIGTAAVMACALVLLDLPLELFCARFPLLFYILVAGFGYAIGGRVFRWQERSSWGAKILRFVGRAIVILGVLGAATLSFYHPPWASKCAWRSCGRLLGPGLLQSPFPPPLTSCQDMHRCANEYQYSQSDYARLCQRMKAQGCEPP